MRFVWGRERKTRTPALYRGADVVNAWSWQIARYGGVIAGTFFFGVAHIHRERETN